MPKKFYKTKKCLVKNCISNKIRNEYRSYYYLPEGLERRNAWLKALNICPSTLNRKRYFVCESHFHPKDYTDSGITIKRSSIPSLHLNQSTSNPNLNQNEQNLNNMPEKSTTKDIDDSDDSSNNNDKVQLAQSSFSTTSESCLNSEIFATIKKEPSYAENESELEPINKISCDCSKCSGHENYDQSSACDTDNCIIVRYDIYHLDSEDQHQS